MSSNNMEVVRSVDKKRERLITLFCLLVIFTFPFLGKISLWLPLQSQRVDFSGDFVAIMLPWLQMTVNAWREGTLPLWSNLEGIGRPLISNIQAAVFYPGTLIMALISGKSISLRMLEAYVLFHISIGAMGVFWLARVSGLKRWSSVFAAFIFSGCGFFLHHISNLALVISAAWVPYAIAASINAFERHGWRWLPACSLFITLSIIGGLPQPAYYLVLFVIFASIYFAVKLRSVIPLAKLALAGLLSFLLGAQTLLPGLRELPSMIRSAEWKAGLYPSTEFFGRVFSFILPHANSGVSAALAFELFFGTIPLILVIVGAKKGLINHRTLILLAASLFLILAVSEDFDIDGFFNLVLPGYNFFREHARSGLIVTIFGALFAAAGLERISQKLEKRELALIVLAALFILIVQIVDIAGSSVQAGNWRYLTFSVLTIISTLVILLAMLLYRKFSLAAIVLLTVFTVAQMTTLTNSNNLHYGTQESMDKFKKQAELIPPKKYPVRVLRQDRWIWSTLDTYNGLNTFVSGDSNKYIEVKILWNATLEKPRLSDLYNIEYKINATPPTGQKPRSPAAFPLNDKNKLQHFDLSHYGKTKSIRLRISVEPDEAGNAEVEAALRLKKKGTAISLPLNQISPPENALPDLVHFESHYIFEPKREGIQSLWIRLKAGKGARVNLVRLSSGEVKIRPRVTPLGNNVYRINDAFPRAYIVPQALPCSDKMEMEEMIKGKLQFDEHVLLLQEDYRQQKNKTPFSALEAALASATIKEYGRHRVVIAVDNPHDAFLVLSDFYHPGWKAYIDNKPAPVLRANFCTRAVTVSAGKHRVEFVYEDPLALLGIFLSLSSIVVIAVTLLFARKSDESKK